MLGEILIAGIASLLLCMFLGPKFIEYLRDQEFGQQIREEGPEGHRGKAGTPTMGGLVIGIAVAVPFLILGNYDAGSLAVFGTAVASGALGFIDDWTKIQKKRSLGVSARGKLAFQVVLSLALWFVAIHWVHLHDTVQLRIFHASVNLGPFYPVLVFLVLAGASNGVNLTDGLDGLAAGCAAIVLLAYTAMTLSTRQQDLALICACLVGACVGFLWFNSFPAAIFMGDTGSLGLGGRDRGARGDDADRGAAADHRRDLRDRGAVGRDPGVLLPALPQAGLPDGARPPPLRADGVVGDEDHPALLDRRRDLLGDRLHAVPAVDQVVVARPPLPSGPFLVVGLARSGAAVARVLRDHDRGDRH